PPVPAARVLPSCRCCHLGGAPLKLWGQIPTVRTGVRESRNETRPRANGVVEPNLACLPDSEPVRTTVARIARMRDQSPNQRARLDAPNSFFSEAYSRDASCRCAAAAGPLR